MRAFAAREYWFWKGYLGLEQEHEVDGIITGRLRSDPSICFRISLEELADPNERTIGYKMAIEEWFNRIPLEPEAWNQHTEAVNARERLREITGRDFDTRDAFKEWWSGNRDYLVWSEKAGHLIVDERARKERAPVVETYKDLEPEDYWFLVALDRLRDVSKRGDSIIAQAWYPPHGYQKVRIKFAAINNRKAKEEGFKLALRNLILDGISLPELGEQSRQTILSQLGRLTGLSMASNEWVLWWQQNRDKLALSVDGEHLVVGTD